MNIFKKNTDFHFTKLTITIVIVFLFNEFTLVYFDKNPPLAPLILISIRIFDILILLLGLFSVFYDLSVFTSIIKTVQTGFISKFSKFLSLIFYYLMVLIFLDVMIGYAGFGYQRKFDEEHFYRVPSPYDYFNGKSNVLDHNEFGFRGKFLEKNKLENNTVSIAFFGGSTGYRGSPSIIGLIHKELEKRGYNIASYNFSSVSSSHTQHVHRLIKFVNMYKFDFVIFFGGANETIAYEIYDPRVGYPYNFYFASETSSLGKVFLQYSNIISEIDLHTGFISGLGNLQKKHKTSGDRWNSQILNKYNEDLNLSKRIVKNLVTSNYCSNPEFISITQPGNNKLLENTKEYSEIWNSLKKLSIEKSQSNPNHLDLTFMSDSLKFYDYFHFENEKSRVKTSEIIIDFLLSKIKNCK